LPRPDKLVPTAEPDWDALVEACYRHPEDPAVTAKLFEPLRPLLIATLVALYPKEVSVAEDAAHNAFLKLLALFRKGPPRKLSEGFFVVVARNCLLDELRRRKGQVPFDELVREAAGLSGVAADEEREFEIRLAAVQAGMALLDPRCRFLLDRYYIAEEDAASLARTLGLAPESIHMTLKRCRDRLRALLPRS
jgi:RNA polymerase sigma factor (sigma-70 family)